MINIYSQTFVEFYLQVINSKKNSLLFDVYLSNEFLHFKCRTLDINNFYKVHFAIVGEEIKVKKVRIL